MASSVSIFILSVFICFLASNFSSVQSSFRPRALVLPVQKDAVSLQYVTKLHQRIPFISIDLVLDLGGKFLWVDCDKNYISSTYRSVRCKTAQCSIAGGGDEGCANCPLEGPKPRPGCNDNECTAYPESITTGTAGEVSQDVLALPSTDGSNSGPLVPVSQFIFVCGRTFILPGVANTVGMAGLSRNRIAMPSQLASAFSFKKKFAICLSGSTRSPGALFFGDGPYYFRSNIKIQADSVLKYTPLLINPVTAAKVFKPGEKSEEYFIGVKSIKINNKAVKLNTTLLSFDRNGVGGTKISNVHPYTELETSIFKAFTEVFIREAAAGFNISRVAGVAPFEVCFSSENVVGTILGPRVPEIDLVLQNSNVVWSIFGSNSMVSVNDGKVLCLGFIDGGLESRTSIVIGGHQLEDNLLQFDLATSRLGFSSTLLGARTTCANFNFTSG